MDKIIFYIICFSVGILLIYFRKSFAREAIRGQKELWGFNFWDSALRVSELISTVIGICLIIMVLLLLFNVIKFKE